MATQAELAYEATVAQLKELAAEAGVDLTGLNRKDDIVEALVASPKVKKDDLAALLVQEEEDDEDGDDSGATESNDNRPQAWTPLPFRNAPAAASTTADSLDPALVDPVATAKAAHKGTVNDASARASGDVVGQGDVDAATVPKTSVPGEHWPEITVEDTVVLGKHELVPERLVGRRAFITDFPRGLIPVGKEEGHWITVKTRDEVNATLNLPLTAVTLERGGRSPTVRG